MCKLHIIAMVFLCAALTGCAQPAATTPAPTAPREIVVTDEAARTGPLLPYWELGSEASTAVGEGVFAILGFQFTPADTKIFYSLSREASRAWVEVNRIELAAGGASLPLQKLIPLREDGSPQVGILVFGPRPPGATEITLRITSTEQPDAAAELLAARFTGDAAEDRLQSAYTSRREGGVDLAGTQVEMLLWAQADGASPGAGAPSGQATVTPVVRTPLLETAAIVSNEFSFEIRGPAQAAEQVVVQFLSDGAVVVSDGGRVFVAEVIETALETGPYPTPMAP